MSGLQKKSFWERPEGTTGMIFAILAVALGVKVAAMLLPLIVSAFAAVVALAGLVGFVGLLMNSKVRQFGSYLFKVAMRFLTGMLIELDPIAILESHVADWKKKLGRVKDGLISVKAELKMIIEDLNANAAKHNQLMVEFKFAKERGNNSMATSRAQMVSMLREQREKYEKMYEQTGKAFSALQRIYQVLKHRVEVEEFSLDTKRDEWKIAKRNRSIVRDATSILQGMDDSELYNRANDHIENEAMLAEAEIEMLDEFTSDLYRSLEARNYLEVERLTREIEQAADNLGSEANIGEIEMIPDIDDATDDIEMLDGHEALAFAELDEPAYA